MRVRREEARGKMGKTENISRGKERRKHSFLSGV
jgi:hypothetical protein